MSSSQANKRVFGYDLLKAIAMFMVVFYHYEMLDFGFVPDKFYIPNFNKIIQLICAAGIPVFFMVNGALTINNKITFKKVINKVSRLFFIAIFWSLVLRCGVIGYLLGNGQPQTLYSLINHYWFFISLAYIYILNYLIQIMPKWFGYLLVGAVFALTFLNNFVWDVIVFVNPEHTLPRWGITGLFTLYGIVYSRIGAYLKISKLSFTSCLIIFLIGLALNVFKTVAMTNHDGIVYDGVNGSFPTIGALFLGVGLFGMLKGVTGHFWSSQLIKIIGINSGGVYIFHLAILLFIRDHLLAGYGIYTLPLFVVLLLAFLTTLLCTYISEGISRTPGRVLLKF